MGISHARRKGFRGTSFYSKGKEQNWFAVFFSSLTSSLVCPVMEKWIFNSIIRSRCSAPNLHELMKDLLHFPSFQKKKALEYGLTFNHFESKV